MVKVILIGSPATQWSVGKSMKNGGTPLDLDSAELKLAENGGLIAQYLEKENKKPKEAKKSKKKYNETELFAMKKAEQVAILEALGMKPHNLEEGRVTQILEAQ